MDTTTTPIPDWTITEQALLGAILVQPASMPAIAEIIEPGDFLHPAHQTIYGAMLTLLAQHVPPDFITLTVALGESMAAIGGLSYLGGLSLNCPSSLHGLHYAGLVREASRKRLLLRAGESLANDLAGDVDTTLSTLRAVIADVERRGGTPDTEDPSAAWDALHARLTGPATDDAMGVPTGLAPLDGWLHGLKKGNLVIVGARPGVGKTSLATTITVHVALTLGRPVLFFTLEMLADEIREKLLSLATGIPWRELTGHGMTQQQQQWVTDSTDRLKAASLEVVGAREWTMSQIRAKAREMHQQQPQALIVVDYLQLIAPEGRRENRTQEVSAISASLKGLSLELECPVLCLSQLNRAPEQRAAAEPTMAELRESGAQEQDASVVLLLWPENQPDEEARAVTPVNLKIDKNRMGEHGIRLQLGFRGARMQFVALAEPPKSRGPLARLATMLPGQSEDTDGEEYLF